MKCLIKDSKVFSSNGEESTLFKELEKDLGATKAMDLFVLSHTNTFKKDVITPLINQNIKKVRDTVTTLKPSETLNVSYKVKQVNGFDTIQMYEGKKLLGYIRLKPYKEGYQIERVLLSAGVQPGRGLGTELYKKAIQYSFGKGTSLYSDQAYTPQAKKVWDKLSEVGVVTKSGTRNKVEIASAKNFYASGEIRKEVLVDYANRQEATEQALSNVEQENISMQFQQFPDLDTLTQKLEDIFIKDGLFNPTFKRLKESGLYTDFEVNNILSSISIQANIKDTLERLKNTPNKEIKQINKTSEKTTEITLLGTVKKVFVEDEQGIEIPQIKEDGSPLKEQIIYDEAVKLVDDPKILEALDALENAPEVVDTTNLENKVIKWLYNFGIDLEYLNKEMIPSLREFILAPTQTNIDNFTEVYKPQQQKTKRVQIDNEQRDYVYLETNRAEQELFDELSLVKTGVDNVYHKVIKVNFEEMKEALNLDDTISEMNAYKTYYNYPLETKKAEVILGVFTGDYEYLTNEFIADFNIKMLNNKGNEFYNQFKITEKGIELIGNIDLVKAYIKDGITQAEDLVNYSIISKTMPNLNDQVNMNPQVEAINSPNSVSKPSGEAIKIDENILVVKNEDAQYVNFNGEIYELQNKDGNLSFFAKINKNEDLNYFNLEEQKTERANTEDLKQLKATIEDFAKVKKSWTKEELKEEYSCYK